MTFTENEVRFLTGAHGRLAQICDLRTWGCPEAIFNRILEDRAAKVGNVFTEFRASHNQPATAASLAAEIAANKLF